MELTCGARGAQGLTGGFQEKLVDQALRITGHDLLLKGGVKRVSLNAQHLQQIQRSQLAGKVPDLVVEEVEGFEVGAHADLGRQLGDEVVGGVEMFEVT